MNRLLLLFLSAFFSQILSATAELPKRLATDPPVIVCPASDSVLLLTGACETVLNFSVTATDAQGNPVAVVQTEGLPSGSIFPPGTHQFSFLATDGDGNTASCSFTITVYEFEAGALTCDDVFTARLDDNCSYALRQADVLQGGQYACWDYYSVEVDKIMPFGNGPWLPAVFGAADIGKQYQYRVTDARSGNKCFGTVSVRDLTGPVIVCPPVTVSCQEVQSSPDYLQNSLGIAAAYPSINDACQAFDLPTYTDVQTLHYGCDSVFEKVILREWEVADLSGNTSTCIQRVQFHRHLMSELNVPPDAYLSCPDNALAPAFTGLPFLVFNGSRYELDIDDGLCNLAAFYNDFSSTLPCGDRWIRRVWEWFDFCTNTTMGLFIQNIYVLDQTPPTVSCPPALTVSLVATDCQGAVDLPDAPLQDGCSQLAGFQASWLDDGGTTQTLDGSLADFPNNDPGNFDTLGVVGTALFAVGTTEITYTATDSCGNTGTCSFLLTVADMQPPSAQCVASLTVTLDSAGTATLSAAALNDGSTDDCAQLSFKAQFESANPCHPDTLWADQLSFCCALRAQTVAVKLRVYDLPLPVGPIGATVGEGHFSECTVMVEVNDPHPLDCAAPPDVMVDCAQFDPTLASYGDIVSVSCAVDSVAIEVDYSQFDQDCKRGTIVRSFSVFDQAGNSSPCGMQLVTVDYRQEYYIKFPDDVYVTFCSANDNYGQPATFGLGCEDLDISFSDQIFTIVPDACYRIERTWVIVNRCTYDTLSSLTTVPNPRPNSPASHPENRPGPIVSSCDAPAPWQPTTVKINPSDPQATNYCVFWSQNANGYRYTQLISIIGGAPPTDTYIVPTCANQNWETANNPFFWNEPYWNDPVHQSQDLCEQPTAISITASNACIGATIQIGYSLYLDLDQNGTQETVVLSNRTGASGLGWNNLLYNNVGTPNFNGGTPSAFDSRPVPSDLKMGFALEIQQTGNSATGRVRWNTEAQPNVYFDPELPVGNHRIVWNIGDGCGNNKNVEYGIQVRDCRAPNVVCKSNLTFDLQPALGNEVTVSASEILEDATDNCTPSQQLEFSLRECGTGVGFPLDNDMMPIGSLRFACNDLGVQCIEVWARDKAGNADKCEIDVVIDDQQFPCNSVIPGVFGWIRMPQPLAEGIGEVNIKVEVPQSPLPPMSSAAITDTFGYYLIQGLLGGSHFIVPERDDNPLNGVTTFDLVLISKHILGTEPFDSPYKMIAADANKSGSVTTFDIVELRKLILGIYDTLPLNRSWRFIDSAFVFPNPLNPFQTAFPEKVAVSNGSPISFVGVKVGDVNLTAVPHAQGTADERGQGTAYMDTENRFVKEGDILQIPFALASPAEGCQLTLEANGLEVLEVLPGEDTEKEHFALFPDRALLAMASEKSGKAQFQIRAKALKNGQLSDMIALSDHIARSEAYPVGHAEVQRLRLRFAGRAGQMELFQNQPNPFSDKTDIIFQLPSATTATISITDAAGRLVWSNTAAWPAGLNSVTADLSALGPVGVLFCRLETAEQSLVRRMVRVE